MTSSSMTTKDLIDLRLKEAFEMGRACGRVEQAAALYGRLLGAKSTPRDRLVDARTDLQMTIALAREWHDFD